MNNEIVKFALECKVQCKTHICKPNISWLLIAIKRCGLSLGEAIETANKCPDWKMLHH